MSPRVTVGIQKQVNPLAASGSSFCARHRKASERASEQAQSVSEYLSCCKLRVVRTAAAAALAVPGGVTGVGEEAASIVMGHFEFCRWNVGRHFIIYMKFITNMRSSTIAYLIRLLKRSAKSRMCPLLSPLVRPQASTHPSGTEEVKKREAGVIVANPILIGRREAL